MSDGDLLPEHNKVSSEWEKNQMIRNAYDRGRAKLIPRLIDLIEHHKGTGVFVASDVLFQTPVPLELWTNPDYRLIHESSLLVFSSSLKEELPKKLGIHGTTTCLFVEWRQEEKGSKSNNSKSKSTKLRKILPDKCLLKHEFSLGCDYFAACKLRRRHQKEIAKHPSRSSISQAQTSPQSSAILEGLARSVVEKQYDALRQNDKHPSNCDTVNIGDSGSERSKTCIANTSVETTNFNGAAQVDHEEEVTKGKQVATRWSVLQEETSRAVTDALSIVYAAKNLEVGEVPRSTAVRWKAEEEFEIRYFKT